MDTKLSEHLDAFSEMLDSALENVRLAYIHKQESIEDLIDQSTTNLEKLKNVSNSLTEREGILKKIVAEIIREMRSSEKKISVSTVSPELQICEEWLEQRVFNSEPVTESELQGCTNAVISRAHKIDLLLIEEKAFLKAIESAEAMWFSFNVWNGTKRTVLWWDAEDPERK